MEFPKSLKIGGHEIEVLLLDDDTNMGEACFNKNVLKISTKFPQSQIEATLFHEILHHSFCLMGYTGHNGELGEEEEAKIEGLSQALYQIFRDNGLLVDLSSVSTFDASTVREFTVEEAKNES